jgi:hypothetical protein
VRQRGASTAWASVLRHGLHQVVDVVTDTVVAIVEAQRADQVAAPGPARARRRRLAPVPSSPPDDLARARAERILRENGYRELE